MIYPAGTIVSFPQTKKGCARAGEFNGLHPAETAPILKDPHSVVLLVDFELKPRKRLPQPKKK